MTEDSRHPARSRAPLPQACGEVRQRLLEAHRPEEQLPPRLEEHLATCPRCRAHREQLTLIDDLARQQRPELPEGFELALRRRLRDEARAEPAGAPDGAAPAPRARRWPRRALAIAAGIVLVLGAYIALSILILWMGLRESIRRGD